MLALDLGHWDNSKHDICRDLRSARALGLLLLLSLGPLLHQDTQAGLLGDKGTRSLVILGIPDTVDHSLKQLPS